MGGEGLNLSMQRGCSKDQQAAGSLLPPPPPCSLPSPVTAPSAAFPSGTNASHFQQIKATNLVNESKSAQTSHSPLHQGSGSPGVKLSAPARCLELLARMSSRCCCSHPACKAGARRARMHLGLGRSLRPLPPPHLGRNQPGSSRRPPVQKADPAGHGTSLWGWQGQGVRSSLGGRGMQRQGLSGGSKGVLGCSGRCCGLVLGQHITDSISKGAKLETCYPSGPSATQKGVGEESLCC